MGLTHTISQITVTLACKHELGYRYGNIQRKEYSGSATWILLETIVSVFVLTKIEETMSYRIRFANKQDFNACF